MGREGFRRRRFLRFDRKLRSQRHEAGAEQFEKEGEMNKHTDPVCGMAVSPATAAGKFDYEGETYYFCNPNCLRRFSAAPQVYLNNTPQLAAMGRPVVQLGGKHGSQPAMATGQPQPETRHVREDAKYTCPMDPEVAQTGPGACPKCGMALEPVTPPSPVTRTEYVCPMHPQIVRDKPGSCPICGMALEPRVVTM